MTACHPAREALLLATDATLLRDLKPARDAAAAPPRPGWRTKCNPASRSDPGPRYLPHGIGARSECHRALHAKKQASNDAAHAKTCLNAHASKTPALTTRRRLGEQLSWRKASSISALQGESAFKTRQPAPLWSTARSPMPRRASFRRRFWRIYADHDFFKKKVTLRQPPAPPRTDRECLARHLAHQ